MLESFLTYLTIEKRFSDHTCLAYKKDLEQFFEFSGISDKRDIQEVNSKLIRGWIVDLLNNNFESTSVNRKLSSLRTFYRWLQKEGEVSVNPVKSVNGPKVSKRLPSFAQKNELDNEKIVLLFDDDFNGVRDRLMFELLYQTGMRSSELVNLLDKNVQGDQIKVLGKRNKERIIPISKELSSLVREYRNLKLDLDVNSQELIVLNNGKKLQSTHPYVYLLALSFINLH